MLVLLFWPLDMHNGILPGTAKLETTQIRYDSSKFANGEIEFRGADNETKIVVTRIRGSESDRNLQLY